MEFSQFTSLKRNCILHRYKISINLFILCSYMIITKASWAWVGIYYDLLGYSQP